MNLETLKTTIVRIGRFLLRCLVAAFEAIGTAALWAAPILWGVTKWVGRVGLWLVFWPVGLWRSWRHGADRRNTKLAAAIVRAQKGEF